MLAGSALSLFGRGKREEKPILETGFRIFEKISKKVCQLFFGKSSIKKPSDSPKKRVTNFLRGSKNLLRGRGESALSILKKGLEGGVGLIKTKTQARLEKDWNRHDYTPFLKHAKCFFLCTIKRSNPAGVVCCNYRLNGVSHVFWLLVAENFYASLRILFDNKQVSDKHVIHFCVGYCWHKSYIYVYLKIISHLFSNTK